MLQVLGQGHPHPQVRPLQARPRLRRLLRRPHHRPRDGRMIRGEHPEEKAVRKVDRARFAEEEIVVIFVCFLRSSVMKLSSKIMFIVHIQR